ncbi:MAG: hypothetical protein AAF633_18510 [Chloroflexota bacterium]
MNDHLQNALQQMIAAQNRLIEVANMRMIADKKLAFAIRENYVAAKMLAFATNTYEGSPFDPYGSLAHYDESPSSAESDQA